MASRSWLLLAFGLLMAVLAVGNPMLGTPLRAAAPQPVAAAVRTAQPAVAPRRPMAATPRPAAAVQLAGLPGHALPRAGAAPAVDVAGEPCPDAALRDGVIAVVRGDDGRPVWILRDGRAVRAAPEPKQGASLVEFVTQPVVSVRDDSDR